MFSISAFLARLVCGLLHAIIRLLGRGGTAFPGRIALRLCPDILKLCSKGVDTLVITGTNGKTTSARMAETAFINAGSKVFSNRSGANLIDGIACEFILNTDLFLRPKKKRAVIECDEAACKTVLPQIKPAVLLVTNLFRDQLDRYGTVTKPRDCIAEGLRGTPETVLCVNADCPMAQSIADLIPNRTVYFGIECGKRHSVGSGEDNSCPVCGKRLRYSFVTYASLGDYSCPSCGFCRHEPGTMAEYILPDGSFTLSADGKRSIVKPALSGLYNIYNAVGAAALFCAAGEDAEYALKAVSDFECGFGRCERFELGKKGAEMVLIKNAAAADQTLERISTDVQAKTLVLIVNDRPADGTDISWLSDTDFSRIKRIRGVSAVYAAGDRAERTTEVLEKQEIACNTVNDYDKLIKILSEKEDFIYILPTYTAMLEFRQKLVRRLGGKDFWE